MAIFKCKMCGGDLQVQDGACVVECSYCGTTQTVSTSDDEKRVNLYNRANRLRLGNEFDKAAGVYEAIVAEFPEEAEAYWGLLLCHYGVEYVDDPATAKKVPTCHRSSFQSVMDDQNLDLACEYADSTARAQYRQEAKQLEEIRKGIIEVSSKEEPYDIFICYKETDEKGERTLDSVMAQDVYTALTEKGYKVFFSRISLEDKLGTEYEPYIFAALNSAKVMLAFGTDYEYYNAVWVKNEWSRFLRLMAAGQKKTLIPCYKNLDVYDIPKEFAKLQAQDMGKVGAMQDLLRGIDKIFGRDKKAVAPAAVATPIAAPSGNVGALLKRAFMFLEDAHWAEANAYCEKVLDQDPENANAYLGKLLAELQVKTPNELKDCAVPFDQSEYYQKALRFGDNSLKNSLTSCITHINERNENVRLTGIYNNAKNAMNAANTESAFKAAADTFATILGFKDADALAEQCLEESEKCKQERLAKEEADRLEAQRKAEERRLAAEAAKKKAKKIALIASPIVVACVIFVIVLTTVIIPNSKYNSAVALMNDGKYEEAIAMFEKMDGYKDSRSQCVEATYQEAVALMEAGKYDEAITAFETMDSYKDSAKKLEECQTALKEIDYNTAVSLMKDKKYDEAITAFEALNGYKDSGNQIESCYMGKYGEEKWNKVKKIKIGDTYTFGSYEQDNNKSNGKEAIEWTVLDKDGMSLFLISKRALDCQQYDSSDADVTWENCTLRKWMNGTFLNNAFSADEKAEIATTNVSADKNPEYSTNPGNATTDKVFLLSITEAEKYFTTEEARKCAPTAYAKAQGACSQATCWWWLRSPGDAQDYAAFVSMGGSVDYSGDYVNNVNDAVRPALWISLE